MKEMLKEARLVVEAYRSLSEKPAPILDDLICRLDSELAKEEKVLEVVLVDRHLSCGDYQVRLRVGPYDLLLKSYDQLEKASGLATILDSARLRYKRGGING